MFALNELIVLFAPVWEILTMEQSLMARVKSKSKQAASGAAKQFNSSSGKN
jgi:hypothetical protein